MAVTRRLARKLRLMGLVAGAIGLASCAVPGSQAGGAKPATPRAPNIIILYADDLGYGDLAAYGAKGIPTPNIDKLVRGGLRLTDAHATAATCTPSRANSCQASTVQEFTPRPPSSVPVVYESPITAM